MAQFLVRVELHDVPEEESRDLYENLHEVMATLGFRRTFVGSDHRLYDLPSAEYLGDSSENIKKLKGSIAGVLSGQQFGHEFSLVVVQVAAIECFGLNPTTIQISTDEWALPHE